MRKIIPVEVISLDDVTQAPGGRKEVTDGGFRHGGWSMRSFGPEVVGGVWSGGAEQCDALLEGPAHVAGHCGCVVKPVGRSVRRHDQNVQTYVLSDTLADQDQM